jgi:hypothetical protein
MNAARVAVVKKVFKVMDKDNSGILDINGNLTIGNYTTLNLIVKNTRDYIFAINYDRQFCRTKIL